MSTDQQDRSSRWLALLAVPVVCCVGHAVVLSLGVGSLAAVTGALTGRVVLGGVGLALTVAAGALALRRTRQR